MAGQGDGEGVGPSTLDTQIGTVKFVLLFSNILTWMIGTSVFGLSMWLRFEPGLDEWITELELQKFYIGVYILILASIVVVAVSFLGCGAALMENTVILLVYIISQAIGFLAGVIGSAVLLEFSTYNSSIQPLIRDSMKKLIVNAAHHEPSRFTLQMVQENIGCCGADGPNDYLIWQQPLPHTCRDAVTGNAYFYGCVDELTWFFEEKAAWVVGLVMTACLVHVINVVLSIVLMQALRKEENEATPYRR